MANNLHMSGRQLQVEKAKLQNEAAVLRELKQTYAQASKDIAEKIRIHNGKIDVLLKDIDNLDEKTRSILQAQIYQRDFQNALKRQIDAYMDVLNTSNSKTMSEYLANCYKNGFIGSIFDMHGQGVPLSIPIDPKKLAKASVLTPKLSRKLYGQYAGDVKQATRSAISRGIATASSYAEISRNINAQVHVGYNKAARIARTEGHRIQASSAFDAQHAARDAGADVVKQWDAALDGRTRDTHQQLDGQIRELDEPFEVMGMTAMFPSNFGIACEDINCRCALTQRARWALDDNELQTLKDRAEYFGLDKSKQFDDFKEKYINATAANVEENPIAAAPFAPAKTIEEAEEYAKNFVDTSNQSKYSGNISYKGVSLENANKMNKILSEVNDKYDVEMLKNLKTMNFREAKWKNAVENGVAAAYQWSNGGTLFINQKIFASEKVLSAFVKKADDLLKQVKSGIDTLLAKSGISEKQVLYLKALKKSGVQCFAQTSGIDFAEATFVHEAGHMLDDKMFRSVFKETGFDISQSMSKYAVNISGYAVSSNAEYIAESFTAFWYGKTSGLDPELVEIFKTAQKKSGVVSGANSGTISSIKPFAKGSKDFPTVRLPKAEFAHVMSEIATNISREQSSKAVFKKAIGNYVYVVENNGFGEYRIIGKERIT